MFLLNYNNLINMMSLGSFFSKGKMRFLLTSRGFLLAHTVVVLCTIFVVSSSFVNPSDVHGVLTNDHGRGGYALQ